MTIYEELVQRVFNGESFHIDFEKQTMKIGKKKIINNGEYDADRILFGDTSLEMSEIFQLCLFFFLIVGAYWPNLPSAHLVRK